jgi:hypothetical protein
MRCKKGDLARVYTPSPRTRSFAERIQDRIVTCVALWQPGDFDISGEITEDTPWWIVHFHSLRPDYPLSNVECHFPNKLVGVWPDEFLRPIRGLDGPDQVLRSVGLPKEIVRA